MIRATLVLLIVCATALAVSIPATRELKLNRHSALQKIRVLQKLHQFKVELAKKAAAKTAAVKDDTDFDQLQQELLAMINNMTLDDTIDPTGTRMCEDSDISTTITYINSAEFDAHLDDLLNEPSLQELLVLILFSGDDYTTILNMIVELFSCPTDASGDLYTLEEQMTLEEIAPVFNVKIMEDPDISAIIGLLDVDPGLSEVQELVASATFQSILTDLTTLGVDTTRLLTLATELTGIPLDS
jgi:hypothetical protein